jgi:hypothetical protein
LSLHRCWCCSTCSATHRQKHSRQMITRTCRPFAVISDMDGVRGCGDGRTGGSAIGRAAQRGTDGTSVGLDALSA